MKKTKIAGKKSACPQVGLVQEIYQVAFPPEQEHDRLSRASRHITKITCVQRTGLQFVRRHPTSLPKEKTARQKIRKGGLQKVKLVHLGNI